MNICDYKREMDKVIKQAPLEVGIQTLVYNLLNDIIINKNLSLLIVSTATQTDNFKGLGGVPDLVVASKNYDYYDDEVKKGNNKGLYGCVEVKATYNDLNSKLEYFKQISGDILTYKKVLYTNGIVWRYYELNESTFNIKEINNAICEFNKATKKEIPQINSDEAVVNVLSGEIKKLEEEKKKLKEDEKKDLNNYLNKLSKKLFNSLTSKWEIYLDVDERKCLENKLVKISTSRFNELMTKLYEIEWN